MLNNNYNLDTAFGTAPLRGLGSEGARYIYIYIYIYMFYLFIYLFVYIHGRFPKFHRVFLGRDPGTLKSDHRVKKTSTLIYIYIYIYIYMYCGSVHLNTPGNWHPEVLCKQPMLILYVVYVGYMYIYIYI